MTAAAEHPSIAFLTLGCPKNEVDTDTMRASVMASSYRVVDDIDDADVVVVNTCSFIQEATEESIAMVLEVTSRWVPEKKNRKVVVAGCMPSRYAGDVALAMPEVDGFLPVSRESELLEMLDSLTGFESGAPSGLVCPSRTVNGYSAYLKISDGCHRSCAYCTIPAIRGPYRSRPLEEIVKEATELVALGSREIVLIGQDITAYGRDTEVAVVLADVVRAVAAVPGVGWIRLMYLQPDGITDELLATIAECPAVCRYLDMPLQHASASVLRAMRRRGDATEYLKLIEHIRSILPDVVLRTTVIAGFPGETRSDMNELLGFLEQARFDYVGVFPYSPEEGTEAADMPNQIPLRTRRARTQRVRDLADAIGFERVAERVGTRVEVLVEGMDEDEGFIAGRTRGQAPEIDGLVVLDKGVPGQVVRGVVVDAVGYDLELEVDD